MEVLFIALIMGFVEGITEFLPISSTGHLILAADLLQFEGPLSESFAIIIQVGAILAVVCLYFQRFWGLLFPSRDTLAPKFSGIYGLFLLFLTSLPASLIGLIFHSSIKKLFSVPSVLFFLVVGAICMLIVEKIQSNKNLTKDSTGACKDISSIDELTARHAFGIGLFQICALCPGFSRSAATIMGGMFLGLSRKTAAEYSFLAAVPIIVAAAGYDLYKSYNTFHFDDIIFLLVGLISSFVFAFIAIRCFISFVSRFTFKIFAYYRIILACILSLYYYM